MTTRLNLQMIVRDMLTGAKLEKAAVRIYFHMPDINTRYLSPIPPGTVVAPAEPKRLTDSNGSVDLKFMGKDATRYFYILVTKPSYVPALVTGGITYQKDPGWPAGFYTDPLTGIRRYREERDASTTANVHPREVFLCPLPPAPAGVTAMVSADVTDPRILPGSPASFMEFPGLTPDQGELMASLDTWNGTEPSHWGSSGTDWPPTGADAGPCGVITGWTLGTLSPPTGTGSLWWQYISAPPPDPAMYSGNSSGLAAAYGAWRALGNPFVPPTMPMPPPPWGWWQTTMTPPPDPVMFPDVASLAAAYSMWYSMH